MRTLLRLREEFMTNWKRIKNEYINGGIGQRELAKKHGISYSSIAKRSIDEKWVELRNKRTSELEEKLSQKTQEKTIENEAEIASTKSRIRKMIFAQIEKRMACDELDNSDFRKLVQNYVDMIGIETEESNDSIEKHNALLEAIKEITDDKQVVQ